MKYNNILQSQKDFFDTNSTKDISFRIEQLKHLKTVLKNNEDKLFKAIYEDLGKSEFECILTELAPIESEINYSIKKIKKWTKKREFRTDIPNLPAKSYVIPEPLGCTLVISAWNYPYHLSLLPVIAAITAGNTAILKPSEISGMVTDCENLDFFDPQMVNSLSVTQIDEIITEFYSEGDTCIIDIKPSLPKITIDQSINDITNERHK